MEQKPITKVDDAKKTHQPHNNNNNKQSLLQKQNPSHISPKQDYQQQQQQRKLPTTTTTNLTKPNDSSKNNSLKSKKPIWDCGSTLYDSFELSSFQKQLDSAIINSARTYSMPRLPSENRRAPPRHQQPPSKWPITSKVSRSFQKLLRSFFRAHKPNGNNHSKPNSYDSSLSSSPDPWFMDPHQVHEDDEHMVVDGGRYFVVYDKPNGLSSIPEAPEVGFSPDINSLVRKTMSARFTPTSAGIYCS